MNLQLSCSAVTIWFQVHYPPYLFECFLFAAVHDLESAAEIGNGVAVFKLKKVDAGIWPSLQSVGSGKPVTSVDDFAVISFIITDQQCFHFLISDSLQNVLVLPYSHCVFLFC